MCVCVCVCAHGCCDIKAVIFLAVCIVLCWGGTLCRSPFRHCATSRKVAASIFFIVICLSHNPSGRTMALGSTQPLTEMSTRVFPEGYRRPVRKADNLAISMCRLEIRGASISWRLSRNCCTLTVPNGESCSIAVPISHRAAAIITLIGSSYADYSTDDM